MKIKDWDDLSFFRSEWYKIVVRAIKEDESKGKQVLPLKHDILNAFVLTPLNEVKVVLLGQDPYPTIGHANGLSFSVNPDVKPLPKSLQNIFVELKNDLEIDRKNGDLSDWAKQGVLLLNSSLTVIAGSPASHAKIGWDALVNEALHVLNDKSKLVFILWGRYAQTRALDVGIDRTKHLLIRSVHPSPLSAHGGFFGSKPFSQANQYLEKHGIKPIKW